MQQESRSKIRNILWKTKDNAAAVTEIHNTYGLQTAQHQPGLLFLDALQQSRSSVYASMFEKMAKDYCAQLSDIVDEKVLLEMLTDSMRYLATEELRLIPTAILQRLSRIPLPIVKYFKSNKEIFYGMPWDVKRMVWEKEIVISDENAFQRTLESVLTCATCAPAEGAPADTGGANTVNLICEHIGRSEKLISVFLNLCVSSSCKADSNAASYSDFLRDVLAALRLQSIKIQMLNDIQEFAGLLQSLVPAAGARSTDASSLLAPKAANRMYALLRRMMSSQCTGLLELLQLPATTTSPLSAKGLTNSAVQSGTKTNANNTEKKKNPRVDGHDSNKRSKVESSTEAGRGKTKRMTGIHVPPVSEWPKFSEGPESTLANKTQLANTLLEALEFLTSIDIYSLFACPVTDDVAPRYSVIIKNPMDLSLMTLKQDQNMYRNIIQFEQDIQIMFNNATIYNPKTSRVYEYAITLYEQWMDSRDDFYLKLKYVPQVAPGVPIALSSPVERSSSVSAKSNTAAAPKNIPPTACSAATPAAAGHGAPATKPPTPVNGAPPASAAAAAKAREALKLQKYKDMFHENAMCCQQTIATLAPVRTPPVFAELPTFPAVSAVSCPKSTCSFSWALCLLMGTDMQQLLLASLADAITQRIRAVSKSNGKVSSASSTDQQYKLPYEVPAINFLLQLCQLSFIGTESILQDKSVFVQLTAPSPDIVRLFIPHLVRKCASMGKESKDDIVDNWCSAHATVIRDNDATFNSRGISFLRNLSTLVFAARVASL